MKTVTIGDFMTPLMLRQSKKLIDITTDSSKWAELIDHQVITPNIEIINEKLGQLNDPRYLAYAVLLAITTRKT